MGKQYKRDDYPPVSDLRPPAEKVGLNICIKVPKTCLKPCNVLSQFFNTPLVFFFFFSLFRRPWYHRALVNPSKAAVSNAYMDANGIGKVITISEAVFQALPKITSNISCESLENLLGGCPCTRYGAYESLTRYLFCLTWSRSA